MFDYKYQIILSNSEKIHLFGEDYFKDKNIFWNTHQSMLKDLCNKICKTGFPLMITDLETQGKIEITHKQAYDNWLESNQPFTCECGK